jgi:hypothetical protein
MALLSAVALPPIAMSACNGAVVDVTDGAPTDSTDTLNTGIDVAPPPPDSAVGVGPAPDASDG